MVGDALMYVGGVLSMFYICEEEIAEMCLIRCGGACSLFLCSHHIPLQLIAIFQHRRGR